MDHLDRPWRELSPEEARDYLDRFLSEQPERIEQLVRLSGSTGGPGPQELNFTRGSLVPLWSWARRRLSWHEGYTPDPVPTLPPLEQPPDEALTPLRELPSWVGAIPGIQRMFSPDTLRLIDMIARYFAEVLLRANPYAEWQVGHSRIKGYAEQNQPVLSWGSDVLNPIALVRVVASRELAGDDGSAGDERLETTFDTWIEIVSDRGDEGSASGNSLGLDLDLLEVDHYDPEGEWTYDIYVDDWFAAVGEDHVEKLIADLTADARIVEVHHEDREHLLVNAPDLTLDALEELVRAWFERHEDEIRKTIEAE